MVTSKIIPAESIPLKVGRLKQVSKDIKCSPYVGTPVKPGTEYTDHSLSVGDKADLRRHLLKLERYLKQTDDINVRTQIARLRALLK